MPRPKKSRSNWCCGSLAANGCCVYSAPEFRRDCLKPLLPRDTQSGIIFNLDMSSFLHSICVRAASVFPSKQSFLLRCMSPLLALSGHRLVHCKCPLLGGKADM